MSVDFNNWKQVTAFNGVVASKEDFETGQAIFHARGGTIPANDRTLPALATWRDDQKNDHEVIVIQMEAKADDPGLVICGIFLKDGSRAICTKNELTFLK